MTKGKMLGLLALLALGCASSLERQREEGTYQTRKELTRQLIAQGDWATAFAYADDLHRKNPDDPEALIMRGIVYREKNLPREAEADLRGALAANSKSAEAHAALGILLDSSGRGSEAETHHRRAVELNPKSPAHLNNLGFSLLSRRKNKEAVQVLQRAARLDPTGKRVRTNLGFAYAALGDLPRAAAEFEMGGGPAETKNNLGFVYEHRGDLKSAYDLYVAALRIDPTCSRARGNLAHVASVLGREIPSDLKEGTP